LPRAKPPAPLESVPEPKILAIRGQRVILDEELARLYGVSTSAFNQAVKRNESRFPADFMFQLTAQEASILKSQSVTSSWGGRRKLPHAFTEHGAVQAANVLRSNRAITMSVHIVRAFIRMRETLAGHRELARRLQGLERTLLALDLKTDARFEEVFIAIRSLMHSPTDPKRPIGFIWPEEKPRKK
jgi:ORF6N domain